MFEVGFTELLLIFVLGLVVLGPEKLPRVASQVGRWLGRARAMARQFREQLEEEANLDVTASRRSPHSPPPYTPPPDYPPADAFTPRSEAAPDPTSQTHSASSEATESTSHSPAAESAIHPEAALYGASSTETSTAESPAPLPSGAPEIDHVKPDHERGT